MKHHGRFPLLCYNRLASESRNFRVKHPADLPVRKWWNWQTHHLEGVAPKGVGVQIPPSAPRSLDIKEG